MYSNRSGKSTENELSIISIQEIAFMSSMDMLAGTSDTESTFESSVLEPTTHCLCVTCSSDRREKS